MYYTITPTTRTGYARVLTATVIFAIAGAVSASAESAGSSGKTIAYQTSRASLNAGNEFSVPFGASLPNGKRRHVLEVDIAAGDLRPSPAAYSLDRPNVNGLLMQGATSFANTLCQESIIASQCTSLYWLDLDEAESVDPGLFVGQPLNIQSRITGFDATDHDIQVMIRARLLEK